MPLPSILAWSNLSPLLLHPQVAREQKRVQPLISSHGYNIKPHMDEFPEDLHLSFHQYMMAGATAGVMEHVLMYPVDTIKTRLQTHPRPGVPVYKTVREAFSSIVKNEGGYKRLYRGVFAIVGAAIPSHAIYFATYETAKDRLGGNSKKHKPLAHAMAGALATMAHDFVVTPLDVVKQRLQMYGSDNRGVIRTMKKIARTEGARAFFLSYPTTLLMNVPFISTYFITYEGMKRVITPGQHDHGPKTEFIAGGMAGGLAGLISTPLDVIKTRIQTQPSASRYFHLHTKDVVKQIIQEDGYRGFTRGATARMLYFIPSAAICWTTYETIKRVLRRSNHDDHDHDHEH